MHIALNGWFWNRPETGSGQYIRQLVRHLWAVMPSIDISLILPQAPEDVPEERLRIVTAPVKNNGHLEKVRFEQVIFPRAAEELGAHLAHVPYWGSPLQSPIPIVVTIHDLVPVIIPAYRGGVMARAYTGLVAAAARGASAIITDSEHSRQDIQRILSIPEEAIHTIHLAAGPDYQPQPALVIDMSIRKAYDLPTHYVLYLGGYDVRKNVRTLLKAYTYVRDGVDDQYPLVLAGRLPDKRTPRFDDVPFLTASMGLEDVVRPIGYVEESHKPALYRMAAAFVYPSRYEGFGLPVLEAMACGTPVIAANRSSLPEIVSDAGFLVEPDDARRMGGAILATLIQDNVAKENRTRGLAQAARFTWESTASQTLAVYEKVLQTAAGKGAVKPS